MKPQQSACLSETATSVVERKVGFLVVTAMVWCASPSYAYELATHARLTYKAYEQSALSSDVEHLKILGINATARSPFGDIYYDISESGIAERRANQFEADIMVDRSRPPTIPLDTSPESIPGWLLRGAIREDDWISVDKVGCRLTAPNPNAENLNRPPNHFYDPIHDIPLTVVGANGEKAPDWTLGTTNFLANPAPANTSRRNHYTIRDAREAMYRALTGRTNANDPIADAAMKAERNKYWATTFRALGDVLHVVEDLAQPQHTRADTSSSAISTAGSRA